MAADKVLQFATPFAVYTSDGLLGEGGSGRVYKVFSESADVYAIKVLNPRLATRDKMKRFKNEILFGLSSRHVGIVPVLDQGLIDLEGKGSPFYVMPLYAETLRTAMNRGLPEETILPLFLTLLDAVEAAHLRNVYHRDLKPENIFLSEDRTRLVVGDFGIAHFEADDLFTAIETKDDGRLANFQYAAPEQRVKGGRVDLRADIWALGLLLNELYTGSVPHGTSFARIEARSESGGFLDQLVDEMLHQRAEDRPKSIDEVKKALIAAQVQAVGRQRLDALEGTVVKATDAPTVQPLNIVSADVVEGRLEFTLSGTPSSEWVTFFRNNVNVSHTLSLHPRNFNFRGNKVFITCRPQDDPHATKMLKDALAQINELYPRKLADAAKAKDEAERTALQNAARAERERLARIAKLQL